MRVIIVLAGIFAVFFGSSLAIGFLMLKRTERIIEICVKQNIAPQKCIELGDAIYGGQ